MVRCKRKGRPGLGYLFRLKRSPQCGGCVFTWVGGWVRRTPVVGHLGIGVPGVRRKAPKSGALSTENPSRTLPGPHPPYPTRYDKGHPRRSPTAARQRHRRKARPPTYPPGEGPELERNPGAQLSHPPIPRRRLVSQAGTVPTHRSRTNPTSEQKQCPRPGGRPAADRTNGDPDGQPNTRTHPSAGPLVDASPPRQPAHHAPIQTNRWHASRRCRRPIRSVMLATCGRSCCGRRRGRRIHVQPVAAATQLISGRIEFSPQTSARMVYAWGASAVMCSTILS